MLLLLSCAIFAVCTIVLMLNEEWLSPSHPRAVLGWFLAAASVLAALLLIVAR